jgi:hypothetical protein
LRSKVTLAPWDLTDFHEIREDPPTEFSAIQCACSTMRSDHTWWYRRNECPPSVSAIVLRGFRARIDVVARDVSPHSSAIQCRRFAVLMWRRAPMPGPWRLTRPLRTSAGRLWIVGGSFVRSSPASWGIRAHRGRRHALYGQGVRRVAERASHRHLVAPPQDVCDL